MKKEDKDNEKNFNEIKKLILSEEEEALHVFRKSDFQSRLTERIKDGQRKQLSIFLWLKKPVPAAMAVLLLLCLGILAVINVFPPSPHKRNARNIAKFLGQTPAFQSTKKDGVTVSLPGDEHSGLEWSIKQVLFSLIQEEFTEKDLSGVLSRVLWNVQAEEEGNVFPLDKKSTDLFGLDKEIEMLKREKSFYRFFSQILKKLEEV